MVGLGQEELGSCEFKHFAGKVNLTSGILSLAFSPLHFRAGMVRPHKPVTSAATAVAAGYPAQTRSSLSHRGCQARKLRSQHPWSPRSSVDTEDSEREKLSIAGAHSSSGQPPVRKGSP